MATPLSASRRISISYVVSGFTHKCRAYAINADSGGLRQVLARDGVTVIDWKDAANGFWDAVRELLDSAVVPPATALLEDRSGLIWNPVDSVTFTTAGLAGPNPSPASQLTMVLRDTTFKKLRFVVMEHDLGYVGHSNDGLGLGAGVTVITKLFNGVTTTSGFEPHFWMVGRSENYLLVGGTVAGATLDSNDKIRRARGLV